MTREDRLQQQIDTLMSMMVTVQQMLFILTVDKARQAGLDTTSADELIAQMGDK